MNSLNGQRILVTRSLDDFDETAEKIRRLGGVPIACPTIVFRLPSDTKSLDEAVRHIHRFDWIFFTSAAAVRFFVERCRDLGVNLEELSSRKIAVIGPATRNTLENMGLRSDFCAEASTAKAFLDEFMKQYPVPGLRVLLPLSDIARRTLPERLSQHGAQVIEVVAYINAPVGEPPETVIRALAQDEIHWALFTSPSTVRNFITSLKDHPEVLSHLHAASIGPTTSAALRELGLEPCIEAREHTLDGLLEAIAQIRM